MKGRIRPPRFLSVIEHPSSHHIGADGRGVLLDKFGITVHHPACTCKMGVTSGDPVDLHVKVGKIALNAVQHFGNEDTLVDVPLGDSVAVSANGIDLVLISTRTQTLSPEVFSNVGIDFSARKILIVKSIQHFYARFSPIAAHVIYMAAPGTCLPRFTEIPYQIASRHRWPMVDDPLGSPTGDAS